MAEPLFDFSEKCPGLNLPDVPKIENFDLINDCEVPDPLRPVFQCQPLRLPIPPIIPDKLLHIRVTGGPVSADDVYDWTEVTPNGLGGWTIGPRSGTAAALTGGNEINDVHVLPGPTVYPAKMLGGTGRCIFWTSFLPIGTIFPGATKTVQITAAHGGGCYDWREVVLAAGVWTPTGVTGACSSGTGVFERRGLPIPPDSTDVYTIVPDEDGTLTVSAMELGSAVIALTFTDGIPAATDSTHPGSAPVMIYYMVAGVLTSADVTRTMYNLDTANAVGGNKFVQGKFVTGGDLFHDYELCP